MDELVRPALPLACGTLSGSRRPTPGGIMGTLTFSRNGFSPEKMSVPIALLLLFASPALAQRLPQTALPDHYRLTVTPDLPSATFTGDEEIDLHFTAPSNTVTLNAAEIEFESATIATGGSTQKA